MRIASTSGILITMPGILLGPVKMTNDQWWVRCHNYWFKVIYRVTVITSTMQAHSKDQFGGGCRTPKSGPFGPKKWTFWTSPPLTLLQKPHFFGPFCGYKWTFCQIWGVCVSHSCTLPPPPATGLTITQPVKHQMLYVTHIVEVWNHKCDNLVHFCVTLWWRCQHQNLRGQKCKKCAKQAKICQFYEIVKFGLILVSLKLFWGGKLGGGGRKYYNL